MNKYLEKIAEIQDRDLEKRAEPISAILLGGLAARELGGMAAKKFAKGRVLGTGSAHHRNMTTQIEAGLRGRGEEVKRKVGRREMGTLFDHEKEHALSHARDLGTKARAVGAGGKPWANQNFSERRNTAQALREHLGKNYNTFKADRKALVQERQQVAGKAVTAPTAKPRRSLSELSSAQKQQKRQAIGSFTENRFKPEISPIKKKILTGAGAVSDLASASHAQAVERLKLVDKLPKGKVAKRLGQGVKAGVVGTAGYHAYHGAHELVSHPMVHEGFQAAARLFGG